MSASRDMTEATAYAQVRANHTGRCYLISTLLHVLPDLGNNRRLMAEVMGGVAKTVSPDNAAMRLATAAPDLLSAARLALALIRDTWPEDHGSEQVGNAWGALQDAIFKATGQLP